MSELEIQRIQKHANGLRRDVEQLLAKRGHVFRDGTGEEWVDQLTETAKECDSAGLASLGRTLRQLAERVDDRSED